MCPAGRTDRFRAVEQCAQGLEELVVEFLAALCDVSGHVVVFELLPELFDEIEIGAVGREAGRFDVVPDEPFGSVLAGVVENQGDALPFLGVDFGGHGVEEYQEGFRVAVRDDEVHQLAACGINRADNILANVPAVMILGRWGGGGARACGAGCAWRRGVRGGSARGCGKARSETRQRKMCQLQVVL